MSNYQKIIIISINEWICTFVFSYLYVEGI